MSYRLGRKADHDIERIYEEGVRQFGRGRARQYIAQFHATAERLGAFPLIARERAELAHPVRAHPFGSHMILYRLDGEDAVILRVRHAREDWQSDDAD